MRWEKELCPIWGGSVQYRETIMMIEENGICQATLLFIPEEVLQVESYDREIVYKQGRDYVIKGRYLIRTMESRIPCATWDMFYELPDVKERNPERYLKLIDSYSMLQWDPVTTTDGRYLNPAAIRHPEYLTGWQVAVTYRTKEKWIGYKPLPSLDKLPKTAEKLKQQKPLHIVLYGDSISFGWDCSGLFNQNPHQPAWIQMLCENLEDSYGVDITYENTSESSMDSDWALEHVDERVCVYHPDLVILGYGMNDRCTKEGYRQKTEKLVNTIRKKVPEAEIILIATSIPNPLLETPALYFFKHQGEYGQALMPLSKEGIAVADVGRIHRYLLDRKRYIDQATNNINHPNDYLARIYGQVIRTLLT